MSTSFHLLRPPFTSVRQTRLGGHTTLGIWVNHAKAGDIVLRNEEVAEVLHAISSQSEDDHHCAVHRGNALTINQHIEPDTCLISEYGELTTLAELRKESNGS